MIKVIKSGLYTSIQDNGRYGYRNIGVPSSGFMDQHSASIANMIVGNNKNESLLEFTLMGTTLLINNNYTISFTGGDFELMINDSKIEMYKPINVKIGDILKVNHTKSGARGYLAVSGTIDIDSFLGSKSFFKNITRSNYLKNGDEIKVLRKKKNKNFYNYESKLEINNLMNAFKGPEYYLLDKESINKLFNDEFIIGLNNRMAYNLEGKIQAKLNSIISSPVLPGTVQLTPSGKMIILHRDCQTSGGYARILQLDKKSINNLAQLKVGVNIKFKLL